MAVTGTNYFANAIVGQPQVGADFDIFDSHSLPRYAVGMGFTRSDGNKFRYCHFGAVTEIAESVATDRSEGGISGTNVVINPTSAVAVNFESANAGAIGSHFVQATLTANANQFAGGYLVINGGTGVGITYRIKGNTATNDPTTSDMRFQLYKPIAVALDQTSDIIAVPSPYSNLEPSTTLVAGTVTGDQGVRGISVVGHSAPSYGWICTHGTIGVVTEANVTAGVAVVQGGRAGTLKAQEIFDTNTNVAAQFHLGMFLDTVPVAGSIAPAYVQFE